MCVGGGGVIHRETYNVKEGALSLLVITSNLIPTNTFFFYTLSGGFRCDYSWPVLIFHLFIYSFIYFLFLFEWASLPKLLDSPPADHGGRAKALIERFNMKSIF